MKIDFETPGTGFRFVRDPLQRKRIEELWPGWLAEARQRGATMPDAQLLHDFVWSAHFALEANDGLAQTALEQDLRLYLASKLSPDMRAVVEREVATEKADMLEAAANSTESVSTSFGGAVFDQFQTDRARMADATKRGETAIAAEREAARFENLPRERREFRIKLAAESSAEKDRDPEVAAMREEHARLVRQGR